MLASFPASMVNQKSTDLGIPNRFKLISSRFSVEALPDDVEALKAALIVARAKAAAARAQQSDDQALIAHLKL
jgi:hypothetical protein